MATTTSTSSPSTSSTSSSSNCRIEEGELEQKLFNVYNEEVKMCDSNGQSTQHIGDEWMRREIRRICGFDVSDRWINLFRKKHGIRYFSGRRHADKKDKTIILSALDVTKMKTTNFLKKRRILRTSRKEYADVDLQVNKEIVRRQNKGERLTNPWIKEYAQYVAYQLHPEIPDIAKFFDANWLYRFKRRYCVELKVALNDFLYDLNSIFQPRSPEENTRSTPQTTSNEDIKSSATSMEVVTSPNYLFPHHYFNLFDQNGCGASIVKQEPTREN